MILVINLNASVDKRYEIEDIEKGKVMRARSVQNTPGGKGLHVANVATILGEDTLVTGFIGGKSGQFIRESLKEDYHIKEEFLEIDGETRECLAFITDDLSQTEILEPGPSVSLEDQEKFIELYKEKIKKADVIAASGSAPKNVPKDFYKRLIEIANAEHKKFLLDTSGDLLKEGIKGKPYFIKPNNDEIQALTGRKVETLDDAINEIKEFQKSGIELVAISMGSKGSVAGYKGKFYKVTFPKVEAVNPVGSGDSYVAGTAVGLERGYKIEDILKMASACGTANAMEEETGFVREEIVNKLIKDVVVEEL